MAPKPLPKETIDSQQFIIDGVTYEITPRKKQGRYVASWLCMECRKGGVSSVSAGNVTESIIRAERKLLTHHAAAHCKKL